MRWIFFSLLGVNLAFFLYIHFFYTPSVTGNTPAAYTGSESVDSLVLVSERELGGAPIETVRLKQAVVGDDGTVSVKSDVIPISRSLCTLVGSFSSKEKAVSFVQKLSGLGATAKVKNLLVSSTVGYWLHLPPLSSRKELLRRLSELQRQGVDSYVIPDGDLKNGISLGMFSEKNRALSLKTTISDLGYEPEVAEVPREKREVWVFLLQGESAKIGDETWSELLSGKELLQKQQNLCSDVASA